MRNLARPFASFLGVVATITPGWAVAESDPAKVAFFETHVRPVLTERCFECHNNVKQEGGVRLDAREAMLVGGESGPAIVPGKPEESLLVEAIRYEGYEMPPQGQLPAEQIDAIVRWIREGAVWPDSDKPMQPSLGDQDAIREVADSHWAFQPIARPEIPEVTDPDWVRQPIDRFVHAKLNEHELMPSRPAPRVVLIRRIFNDLVGLPPTREIVRAVFARETLDGMRYVDIVDGLLASEHYGERMARHWMDVARYADTQDFLAAADLRYPFAYTYRDWLINAFNEDMPYDEFVRHQLAADFISERPDDANLAALGFLTVGPLFRNNVHERTADRIDVVTRGLMGLTGSCARCHDHKYDPISIEDYYSLYGVFRDSVTPDEFPQIESPLGTSVDEEQARAYEEAHAAAVSELETYEASLATEAEADIRGRFDEYLLGYVELNVAKSETTRGLLSKRKLKETAITPLARNLDQFRRVKSNRSDAVLGPLVALLAAPDAVFEKQKATYLRTTGESLNGAIRAAVNASTSRTELAKEIGVVLNAAVSQVDDASLAAVREAIDDPKSVFQITPEAASQASRLLGTGRRKLQVLSEAIKDVEAAHPGAPPKAMVLRDADRLGPVYVMYRGEPSRRGPDVDRRFLAYFAGRGGADAFENGTGRLELAQKICAADNPLTARVLANRIWRMHFGAGLVDDAGDFGLRSAAPVHGDLLDYLASSLLQNGWSIKSLHRQILLSNTYRQHSSAMSPPMRSDGTSAAEIDADNRLLWRQNRRRLDFESMRDGMLAAANTIDLSVGGKSVPLSDVPHPTRRTVYAYIDRVEPDPLFATFDVPSPDVSTAQRVETLVPQQALFAMNNPFVAEQARAMVASDEFLAAKSDKERVEVLVDRVMQREVRPNEVASVSRFVVQAEQLMAEPETRWEYGYGPVEGSPDTFRKLSHFDGNRYTFEPEFPSPTAGFVSISRIGGHPGVDSNYAAIRRWIAPEAMTVRIGGLLERKSDRGDGIRGLLRVNGRPMREWTVKTGNEKTAGGVFQLAEGDVVDFVVDPLESSTSDSFRWTVVIEQRSTEPTQILSSWSSGPEFEGPLPPPLTPWEQAAQALLMTNEFLFVD